VGHFRGRPDTVEFIGKKYNVLGVMPPTTWQESQMQQQRKKVMCWWWWDEKKKRPTGTGFGTCNGVEGRGKKRLNPSSS